MADRPMNPYAAEDFQNAIKEASEKLKEMGEKMKCGTLIREEDFPYIGFNDLEPEYCGTMRLNYDGGMLQFSDLFDALLLNGYEMTARVEDATETERNLDRAEKWIVIEYGEVE